MASGRLTGRQRRGAAVAALAATALVAVLISTLGAGSGLPALPKPGVVPVPRAVDPFAYEPGRAPEYASRATAGSAHVLFTKSPGGVFATAARVAAFRGEIDAAAAGSDVDPGVLEGIVFLESAGRPDAIAGGDPAAAAGLTQILPQTGQALLGMHIDLAASKRLTTAIDRASELGRAGAVTRLEAARARVDDRFNPRKALAATVRYLTLARLRFGRADLAVESYHMGIANLQQVLDAYDGGGRVPYVQLFFDTSPVRHAAAYRLLSGFGDDSWLYYWRVLGAAELMLLYRTDRAGLARLSALQTATDSAAEVLHPPAESGSFGDPGALAAAYVQRAVVPLPSNAAALGLAYDPALGSLAAPLHVPPRLYRGLRPEALDLLIELAAEVRKLSRSSAPLTVTSAVNDARYQQLLGVDDPPAAAGWSFTLARTYVSSAQATAMQATLDRLQALDLIAWQRYPSELEVTVAADAAKVIVRGP